MSQDQPKASLDDLFDEPIKDSDYKHLRLIKGMLSWFKPSNQETLGMSLGELIGYLGNSHVWIWGM